MIPSAARRSVGYTVFEQTSHFSADPNIVSSKRRKKERDWKQLYKKQTTGLGGGDANAPLSLRSPCFADATFANNRVKKKRESKEEKEEDEKEKDKRVGTFS
jgi:hypothetical protein